MELLAVLAVGRLSLLQLERQLRPEVYRRRRGGYLDRRRTPTTDG
jgi:hypothetical protein